MWKTSDYFHTFTVHSFVFIVKNTMYCMEELADSLSWMFNKIISHTQQQASHITRLQ